MTAYIKGAALISPQNTFSGQGFPAEVTGLSGVSFLKCIEPVYRDFIDPMVSRRMSRIVKMGVCAAIKCLHNSRLEMPDAIITGTGLGCLEDTGKFLGSVYTSGEKLLNPTPFIQSTHNTVAGAIALAIKCHGYNATYTHRGFSFESALEDAILQLAENAKSNILTGGFDEITAEAYTITRRLGLWKTHPVNNLELAQYRTRGSLPGEGVAFFMLGSEEGDQDLALLKSVKTLYKPGGYPEIERGVDQFLHEAGLSVPDIDLVLLGINGNVSSDRVYYQLMENILADLPFAYYKHLCGEYDTSSAFAMWLATWIVKNQEVPGCIRLRDGKHGEINNILIYNHLRGSNHALYWIKRC